LTHTLLDATAPWTRFANPPPLAAGWVHVWNARANASVVAALGWTLSEEELARAAAFRFARDRLQFIAAHGMLRSIVAHYVGIAPDRVLFSSGPFGKPALAGIAADSLRFNLSHSGSAVLCAVACDREVGVDVEERRDAIPLEEIAARFFTLRERLALSSLRADARRNGFFECWTRKEALIKAWGRGLGSLGDFSVSIDPDEPIIITHEALRYDTPVGAWSVRALRLGGHYAAAVAAAGDAWQLEFRDWLL
jgi:4'-phosphopantetheinyl transferase